MNDHKLYLPASGQDHAVSVTHLKVSVYYSKGGANYFNYNNEPSAIWCSISPIERKPDGTQSMMLFSGGKFQVEPATRLNQKKVAEAFERVKAEIAAKTGKAWNIVQTVAAKCNVTLTEAAPA